MEKTVLLKQSISEALNKVDFVKRYKSLSEKYNEGNYDLLLNKIDKKVVLKILKDLGYEFTYSATSKDFIYKEAKDDLSFQLNLNFKNGICSQFIGVYYKGNYVEYASPNWAFIYRHLLQDMNAPVTSAKVMSYEELTEVSKIILQIFSDFKSEFLKLAGAT